MKRFLLLCVSVIFFAGCAEELQDIRDNSLTVSFEPITKVQLNENQQTVWNKGDLVSVYYNKDVNEKYRFTGETGVSSGIIQRAEIGDDGNAIDEKIVVYPYNSDYVIDVTSKTITTTFPSIQTYLKDSYGIGENVMISSGINDDFYLKNVFGWMKIQLIGSTSVKSIQIYDNNFENINGPIDINYEDLSVTLREYGTKSIITRSDAGGTIVDPLTITLNCGEDGVTLDPDTPTSFYISLLPHIFSAGFTLKITGTDGTTKLTKSTDKTTTIERNKILTINPFQFGEIVEEEEEEVEYSDLCSDGTANCYIVSEAGNYKFSTVQGNSSISVGEVASAEVLWETFGTDVAPTVGDLVSDANYSDGYITFKASNKKGNALIAAKDADGTILWSWHIWMTDQPVDQVYNNYAGTMMDRNLGATSAIAGEIGAWGLLYQWGRKDPFMGGASLTNESLKSESTLTTWETIATSEVVDAVEYATAHPTTYITASGNWCNDSEVIDIDLLWNSEKTIYDPCPTGYRVPDGGVNGIWDIAFGTSESIVDYCFSSSTKGFNLTKYATSVSSCWYPASGYLIGSTFALDNSSLSGYYWSCTPYESLSYDLYLCSPRINPTDIYGRSLGFSVRCLKEDSSIDDGNISKEETLLDYSGRANCYIVSSAGTYSFATVKGNSSTSVGTVVAAEVLWESFGTDVSPSVGDLVSNVKYSNGRISFTTTNKEGNAVIAAKDASGTILWSWHIWMTDKREDHTYTNYAGTMMDRNLGATSANPGDVGALGLLYQWGRKDPFLGSSSISSGIQAESTIIWPSAVSSNESTGTISYVVANPTTFITDSDDWYYDADDETSNNARWRSTKTIYDPCPAGYRIPDYDVWAEAFDASASSFKETDAYDDINKGFDFSWNVSTKYLTGSKICWYPLAGYLYCLRGDLSSVGYTGCNWALSSYSSTFGNFEYCLYYYDTGFINPTYTGRHADGYSVRCSTE